MALNLIDAAKALFTSDVISRASSQLGENESGISKALSGIIPTILMGLLSKVNGNDSDAVARAVRDQPASEPGDLSSWLTPGGNEMLSRGTGLLGGLFGNKSDVISSLISNFAGVKSSTSSSLLSMAVPVILGLLRRNAPSTEPSGIASLLNSQRSNIQAAVPAGLNLSSVFGNIGDSVTGARTAATTYTTDTVKRKGMGPLLPILLLLGAAILAFLLFGKGCNTREAGVVVGDTMDTAKVAINDAMQDVKDWTGKVAGKFDSLTNEFVYDEGNRVTIDLPNNSGRLDVGENSTENRLYRFLSDPDSKIDAEKGNWFEFTNVKFKTGSSDITDESLTQLKNLVAITKGYPSAKFKIGGYTDNTGSREANIALSQRRAEAVAAKLKELGATAASIVETEGYGPEWPVADNSTPEGRAQNRRVAVNVKAK